MSNTLARNKKAYFDYEIFDELEVGIVLTGGEVKSIKSGRISLKESFVKQIGNDLMLVNANVSQWEFDTRLNYDPTRSRKLLINKIELSKILLKSAQQGYTIVPLTVYLKESLIKIKIGLAKGKKTHEKKSVAMEKDLEKVQKRNAKALRF